MQRAGLLVILLFSCVMTLAACGDSPTAIPASTPTPMATATPGPTETPQPTVTPVPPTATSIPPTATPTPTAIPRPTPTPDTGYLITGIGSNSPCSAQPMVGQTVNSRNVRTSIVGLQCLSDIKDPINGKLYKPKDEQNEMFLLLIVKIDNNTNSAIKSSSFLLQDTKGKTYGFADDIDFWIRATVFAKLPNDFNIGPGKSGRQTQVFSVPRGGADLSLFTF